MKPNFIGVPPLAMDTAQKYLKTQNHYKTENTSLKFVCTTLFILTCFNTLFSVLMVYKNSMLVQENMQLIKENSQLITFHQSLMLQYSTMPLYEDSENLSGTERFERMIDVRFPREDCPPCTTEKPTIVQPHKNPVSVLNELTRYAEYDCSHICLNPPIHFTKLTIANTPHLEGQEFVGKGESKQKAKQVAAYRAIQKGYPEHEDQIAEEYIPDENYNPICIQPSGSLIKSKC